MAIKKSYSRITHKVKYARDALNLFPINYEKHMDVGSSSAWAHPTAESSDLGVLWPAPVNLDIPLWPAKIEGECLSAS